MPSTSDTISITSDDYPGMGPRGDGRESGRAAVLAVATVLMGLIAGFFYAYACSVMVGLAETDNRTFIHTMQSINATVRNAAFAPSFFGSLVVTGMATALYAKRRQDPVFRWVAAGLALYAIAFVITFAISVPLNNDLAEAGHPDLIDNLGAVRESYEGPWVRFNVARTVASIGALGCLVRALMVRTTPARRSSEPIFERSQSSGGRNGLLG